MTGLLEIHEEDVLEALEAMPCPLAQSEVQESLCVSTLMPSSPAPFRLRTDSTSVPEIPVHFGPVLRLQEAQYTADSVEFAPLPARPAGDDSYRDLFLRSQPGSRKAAKASHLQSSQGQPPASSQGQPKPIATTLAEASVVDAVAHVCTQPTAPSTLPTVPHRKRLVASAAREAGTPTRVEPGARGMHVGVGGGTTTSRGSMLNRAVPPVASRHRSGNVVSPRGASAGRQRRSNSRGRAARLHSSRTNVDTDPRDEELRAYLLAVMRAVEETEPIPGSHAALPPSAEQLEVVRRSLRSFEAGGTLLDVCAICLEEMGCGQEVARLPCRHCFHAGCIHDWLPASLTCPLCKQPASL